MSDSDFQNFSTVQSKAQLPPVTIPSAAIVRPVTFLTFITGTVAIETIIPPLNGMHMLIFIFTAALPVAFLTTGNIIDSPVVPDQNIPVLFVYNPLNCMYYPGTWSD